MIQMVRTNAHKLDRPLREKVINLYKPFKWMPCFLHKTLESVIRKRTKLSVIIQFKQQCFEEGCKEVKHVVNDHVGCKMKKEFSSVSCCSADVTPSVVEGLLKNCHAIQKIYLNREVHALLDVAVPSASAKNIVRNGTKLTGRGVTVAVLDTGIYPHRDLAGRIIDFVDFINNRTEPYDDNGHGTHCAGDAAGDGSTSSGRYVGPAPEANVIGVKVLDKRGAGSLAL